MDDIEKLQKSLRSLNVETRRDAAEKIANYYLDTRNWRKLQGLLRRRGGAVKGTTALTLMHAYDKGYDIDRFIPVIKKIFLDHYERREGREKAAKTLVHYLIKKDEKEEIDELLLNDDPNVVRHTAHGLGHHYLEAFGKPRWKKVEELLDEGNGDVGMGAARALKEYGFDRIPKRKRRKTTVKSLLSLGDYKSMKEIADMGENVIPLLVKEFLSNDKDRFREKSAWALEEIAKRGGDITSVVPVLEKLRLGDPSDRVRGNSAGALTVTYVNDGKTDKIEELLKHKDEYAAWVTAEALMTYGFNKLPKEKRDELETRSLLILGGDLEAGFESRAHKVRIYTKYGWEKISKLADREKIYPLLINFLNDESERIRINSVTAFNYANRGDRDIRIAVPALGNALQDSSITVKKKSLEVIISRIYHGETDVHDVMPDLIKALNSADTECRTAYALCTAVQHGMDISEAVPALEKVISKKDDRHRISAVEALTISYIKEKEWDKVWKLWGDAAEKNAMIPGIKFASEEGMDIAPLIPELEKILENKKNLSKSDKIIWLWGIITAVAYHYIREENWEKINKLLEDDDTKSDATNVLKEAARKGVNISPLAYRISKEDRLKYEEFSKEKKPGKSPGKNPGKDKVTNR